MLVDKQHASVRLHRRAFIIAGSKFEHNNLVSYMSDTFCIALAYQRKYR